MLPELTLTPCQLCGAPPATNSATLSEPLSTVMQSQAIYWVSCPGCGWTTFPKITPLGAISAWEHWMQALKTTLQSDTHLPSCDPLPV